MKKLVIFHSPQNAPRTVMETIMKPLVQMKRPGRWLMAAAMALGLSQAPAQAEELATALTNNIFQLEPPAKPVQNGPVLQQTPNGPAVQLNPDLPGPVRNPKPELVFTKTGMQIECDYVVYKLHFSVTQPAANWVNPTFIDELKKTKLDLSDTLAPGLAITNVTVVGDVTNAGGGGAPLSIIGTIASPNDTVKISDFRLSASDLNGDGSVDTRGFDVTITAKIDRAAFPAATVVDNQAIINVTVPSGGIVLQSQDPSQPDDGNPQTGVKTKITIDVTKCKPPVPHNPGGECFKVDTGTVDCDKNGLGTFVYHMNVGADMAGKVIELSTTNPGVTIAPAGQVVPAGGGVLDWTITGAMPGDVVHIVVVGVQTFAGPEEGWGICCTQTIDITIPKNLDCPKPKVPDIKVEKKADVDFCTLAGGCKFTIRVSNVGSAPYNGPIVLDEVTLPGNATIDSGPNAPWVCAPATSPMTCSYPATTLNPGAFIDLKIGFKPGPGWSANYIRNCAEYNYTKSGKPLFGSQANDKACASIPLCRPNDPQCGPPVEKKADLSIRKVAKEFCDASGLCLYGILVTNVGTTTYNGPLTVIDEFPGGAPVSVNFAPTPPWVCALITASKFQCDRAGVVLVPGASVPLVVKAVVGPTWQGDKVENCGTVKAVPDETNLANNKACATAKLRRPDGKPDLKITKTCSPGVAGAAVSCTITVTNNGTAAPVGPVRVDDAATMISGGAAVNIQSVTPDGADWSCSPVPAPNLNCQIPGAVMTPGTSRHFTASLTVSGNGRWKNCARGSFGPAPGDDQVYPIGQACAEGGVDIVVKKTGPAQCEVGQPCAFTITITNNGSSDFSGPVQVGDAIELEGIGRLDGVAIQSIAPPFGCAPEPTTLPFGCMATINIPAGASQPHVVTVIIPDSDALANVTPNGVSGRNCVGVTGERVTIGAAGNSALGQIDRGDNGAVSCHPFQLVKKTPEKQCSEGFVLSADGLRCVCPEGTRFNKARGGCTGNEPTKPLQPDKPTDVEQPKLCKLLPGMIRTQNGNCVCPRGTELTKRGCVKVPPVIELCKLQPGQIRTKDNRCICPRGTELGKRGCVQIDVPVRQCTLLPGQIRTKNGSCICPRGTVLGKRGCVQVELPQRCPRGQVLIDGQCMSRIDDNPPIRQACPRGTVGIYPVCVDPGQIKRRCPRGTVGEYPNCESQIQKLPTPGIQLQRNLPGLLLQRGNSDTNGQDGGNLKP